MQSLKESERRRKADPWCVCGHRTSAHVKLKESDKDPTTCGVVIKERPCGCVGWKPSTLLNSTGD